MKAVIGHVGLNLSSKANLVFWQELLEYLDFKIMPDGKSHFDAWDGRSYLCIGITGSKFKAPSFHRKRTGLNHVALAVESADMVDQFTEKFLKPRGIDPLYGGVKAYPKYIKGYYAVYFEDRDRIKVEVVYDPTG